jgi:hypothetical protein
MKDFNARLVARKRAWDDAKDAVPSRVPTAIGSSSVQELVAELRESHDVRGLRELLATGIQAVLVRPAG